MEKLELDDLSQYLPSSLRGITDPQKQIPSIARDQKAIAEIQNAILTIPTKHTVIEGDARACKVIPDNSVHLVLTSPPYWTLKEYRQHDNQLGFIEDYNEFLAELDKVWAICYRALGPGGRLVCVVGDVCISRRKNQGIHNVIPLHASIQEHCRKLGFANLAPIIWQKIANASYEVDNGTSFLGKPYEPNGVIKNDVEYILMERKPGGYRKPSLQSRILSVISEANHRKWFQQIWTGLAGASTKSHPAPYPQELADRLVRMFSFVGDTVLDPFMGTGTTNVAASRWGRNSIGIEVDPYYYNIARTRLSQESQTMFSTPSIQCVNLENEYEESSKATLAGCEAFLGDQGASDR
ncbi:MAG: DNA-methyltransferase [Dehalococcoidia bacterium]